MPGSSLRLSSNPGAAAWLRRRLGAFGTGVGSVVPLGYPAYARILHRTEDARGTRRRWTEVAASTGSSVLPGVLFDEMTRGRPIQVDEPAAGTLPPEDLAALVPLLRRHTERPERCWVGVWDGFDPAGVDLDPTAARVELPGREYVLFTGALEGVLEPPWVPAGWEHTPQSPSLWWPDDHAWVVATDVDLDSTYVAGSVALVDAILADAELEAVRADASDPV
jgi:hypothetical protein